MLGGLLKEKGCQCWRKKKKSKSWYLCCRCAEGGEGGTNIRGRERRVFDKEAYLEWRSIM